MLQYLLILPLIIALVFGLFFIIKQTQKFSFRVLGAFFILFAVTLGCSFIVTYAISQDISNHFINISSLFFYVFLLAIPPTFYIYVTTLSDSTKISTYLPHYFIPVTLFIINFFAFSYLSFSSNTTDFIYTASENVMNYANFFAILFIFPILNIYYIYKSVKFYKLHKKKIKDVFSFDVGVNLKWMLHYISGYIIFMLCIYLLQFNILSAFKTPISVFMILYLGYVGLKGLKQTTIIFDDSNPSDNTSTHTEKSSPETTNNQLTSRIIEVMTNDALYLNSDLTIHQLSKKVNSNSKTISQILNTEFKQNFVSFINSYRIDHAKKILSMKTHEHYTIEAIGEESGFNSKSAFNRAFKKYTNSTPSQYKKEYSAT